MNYESEIFTRLMNGEDKDAIASELEKAMNAAIAKSEKEKEAKETERIQKEEDLLRAAGIAFGDYIAYMFPDFAKEAKELPEVFVAAREELGEALGELKELVNLQKKKPSVKFDSIDDIIADFLNTYIR